MTISYPDFYSHGSLKITLFPPDYPLRVAGGLHGGNAG